MDESEHRFFMGMQRAEEQAAEQERQARGEAAQREALRLLAEGIRS